MNTRSHRITFIDRRGQEYAIVYHIVDLYEGHYEFCVMSKNVEYSDEYLSTHPDKVMQDLHADAYAAIDLDAQSSRGDA